MRKKLSERTSPANSFGPWPRGTPEAQGAEDAEDVLPFGWADASDEHKTLIIAELLSYGREAVATAKEAMAMAQKANENLFVAGGVLKEYAKHTTAIGTEVCSLTALLGAGSDESSKKLTEAVERIQEHLVAMGAAAQRGNEQL